MKIAEWWPHIVKYFFWGIVIAFIPICANFILKSNDNRLALNQLILTQGFQPYRAKQLECIHKNIAFINLRTREFEDWKLIDAYMKQDTNNYTNFAFASSDKQNKIILLMKDAFKANKQIVEEQSQLIDCHDEVMYNAENLAMLLNVLPQYQKIVDDFQINLNKVSINQKAAGKSALATFHLPPLNNISDVDKYNKFLINADNFFQGMDNKELSYQFKTLMNLNINIREKQVSFAIENYSLWRHFYAKTNRMYIQAYQKRLS